MDFEDPLLEGAGAVALGRKGSDPLLFGGDVDQEHEEACVATSIVRRGVHAEWAREVDGDEIEWSLSRVLEVNAVLPSSLAASLGACTFPARSDVCRGELCDVLDPSIVR